MLVEMSYFFIDAIDFICHDIVLATHCTRAEVDSVFLPHSTYPCDIICEFND